MQMLAVHISSPAAWAAIVCRVAAACRIWRFGLCMLKLNPQFLNKLMLALRHAHVVWGLLIGKVLGAERSYQQTPS